jgi:predicted enzyme related to lactoylglutathione lyase
MTTTLLRSVVLCLLPALSAFIPALPGSMSPQDRPAADANEPEKEKTVHVHYLEIVTPDVDATCSALAKLHGVTFAKPAPELGNARTAKLRDGGLLGVRAPMHAAEEPVVRPYVLVDDLDAAVAKARADGAEIAVPSMEIAGRGKCAIYFLGGIQHGLWEL